MLFLTLILRCYVIAAFVIFMVFLQSFLRDKTTPKNHISSWKALGLIAIFWPIIVSLAGLERYLNKASNHTKKSDTLQIEKQNDIPNRAKNDNVIYLNHDSKKPSTLDGSICPIYPNWQHDSKYPIEKKIQG